MFKTLLVPVDGSPHASKALELGADLAAYYGARLYVYHVLLHGHVPEDLLALTDKPLDPEPPIALGGSIVEGSLSREALEDIGAKILERAVAAAKARGAGDVVSEWAAAGRVPDAILDKAGAVGADAIVIGSRGLSDLRGLLIGSVSHKVAHVFEGSVITVK